MGRAMYEHEAPVFSSRWSIDGTKIISGGADNQVKIFDLATQQAQQIGQHDSAVKSVRYVECGPTNTKLLLVDHGINIKILGYEITSTCFNNQFTRKSLFDG